MKSTYDGRGRLVREHRPDPDQAVLSTVTIDDGEAGFSTPGGWTADTAGHQGDSLRRAAEGFNGAANWTFAITQAGWYRVSATWPAAAGQAEDAAYSVLADGVLQGTIRVDQTAEPGTFAAGGTAWETLDAVYFDGTGTLTITIRLDSGGTTVGGFAVADAVRLDRIAAGPTTAFAYDALGRQTKVTDPLGRETTFEYDGLDRVTKTTQPDPDGGGPDLAPETVSVYDAVGQLLEEKQRLTLDQGQPVYITTGYGYDSLGRRTRVTDANGDVTAYVYDAVGNLLSVTDASENTTTFVYDDLDRLESETNQSGHARTYEYDAVGNRTRMTDRNGRTREFTYDGLDRPDEEQWLDDQAQVVETIDWDYDEAGRLQSVTDGDSAYAYTYDRLDRLETVSNAGTSGAPVVVFTSTYDAVGNPISRSETIGGQAAGTITSVYDGLDRLIRREQSGTGVSAKRVDLDYNALGQYTTITRYADLAGTELVAASTYGYDGTNRLEDLDHAQGATPLAGYHLDYDPLSRITGFTADADGTSDLTYDALGQLTDANHAAGQADESYAYDDTGNRTGTDYVTVADNRVTTDGRFTYEYDQEGNRTRRTDLLEGVSIEYEWDHRNRLTGLAFRNQLGTLVRTVEYDYDADGRRIAKHVDDDLDGQIDTTARFVYDGPHAALVFDGAGSLTNRYLHGDEIDQVFADENAVGDVLWPLADHQNTVRDLAEYDAGTDMTTVANHRTFDSFGNVTAETNAAVDHLFAYTGREWDADAELYNYRARWYDPAAGRFVSEDPLGFDAGDVNLVRYVTNSPWNFTDPTGQISASPVTQALAQIVAPTATNFVNTVTAWSGAVRSWSGGLNHAYDLAGGGNDIALQAAVAATSRSSISSEPPGIIGSFFTGLGHGAAIVGNTATFGLIDSLDAYVSNVVNENRHLGYQYAEGAAVIGREALITAASLGTTQVLRGGAAAGQSALKLNAARGLQPVLTAYEGLETVQSGHATVQAIQAGDVKGAAFHGALTALGGAGFAGSVGETVEIVGDAVPYRLYVDPYTLGSTGGNIGIRRVGAADQTGRIIDQINGPGQRLAGQVDEIARRRHLATDPASGRYRRLEEQAALRLEQRVGRLRRDPSGIGDWLDTAGRSYDAVGPVPLQRINTGAFINQINRHLNKQGLDRVVVDVTGFNSAQRGVVFNHLRTLDQSQIGRIQIQRTR